MHFYPEGFLPILPSNTAKEDIPLKNIAKPKKITFSEYVQSMDDQSIEIKANFNKKSYLKKSIYGNQINPQETVSDQRAYCVTLPVIYNAAGFYFFEKLQTREHIHIVLNSFQKVLKEIINSPSSKLPLGGIAENIKADLLTSRLKQKTGMPAQLLNQYLYALDSLFKDKIFTDALDRCLSSTF